MFAAANDTLRSISISCPGDVAPATRDVSLDRRTWGVPRRVRSADLHTECGTVILEQTSAASGSVTITASSDAEVAGRFGFEGELVVGTEPAGPVSVSGAFNATNLD